MQRINFGDFSVLSVQRDVEIMTDYLSQANQSFKSGDREIQRIVIQRNTKPVKLRGSFYRNKTSKCMHDKKIK